MWALLVTVRGLKLEALLFLAADHSNVQGDGMPQSSQSLMVEPGATEAALIHNLHIVLLHCSHLLSHRVQLLRTKTKTTLFKSL